MSRKLADPSSPLYQAPIQQLRPSPPQPNPISTLHGYSLDPGSDSEIDEPEPEQKSELLSKGVPAPKHDEHDKLIKQDIR